MAKRRKMLKFVYSLVCISGIFISINAATNARIYALGSAYFLGDILNSVGQGWQMLGYPDQIQGSADFTGPRGKPGPVVIVKSLGENVAIGTTLNTFDRRTGGSVLASTGFLKEAILITPEPDTKQDKFPNWPQLHLGFKIGEQKIGIDAFYETQNYGKRRSGTSIDTLANMTSNSEYKLNTSVHNVGGKISARFAFGNFAWNPWFSYGVPFLAGSARDELLSSKITGTDTVTLSVIDAKYTMEGADRMLTFGSCLDYTFGDWGWAIIGGWYRNETFQFKSDVHEYSTVNGTSVYDDRKIDLSARWDNKYYDYFASITPNIFDDFLIGFEYQGGFNIIDRYYDDKSENDTAVTTFYNDIIVAMEKPLEVNRSWCDKFTPRGSLRYSFGRVTETVEMVNGSVEETIESISTMNGDLEGMAIFFGFGYVKKRMTIDFAMRLLNWNSLGLIQGAPPASVTMTVDLHK